MSTAIARCLMLQKQLEMEVGEPCVGRPEHYDLPEHPHLQTFEDADFGHLPIDSGFSSTRVFSDLSESNGEVWLRGRLLDDKGDLVMLTNSGVATIVSDSQDLLDYSRSLTADTIVDAFGVVKPSQDRPVFNVSKLYGVSEGSGEDRSDQANRVAKFQLQSNVTQKFREKLLESGFVEATTAKLGQHFLRQDVSKVFSVEHANLDGDAFATSVDALMEIRDNYSELVSLVADMMSELVEMNPKLGSAVVLTFQECLRLLNPEDSVETTTQLDMVALRGKVWEKFSAGCLIIDKLPNRGDSMPDPYNPHVCNQFLGYVGEELVIRGQQNVHDATRIHQTRGFPTHHGTVPHGQVHVDVSSIVSGLGLN